MMRRGPLDTYPPEWVLRQAAADRAWGTLELHGSRPTTLYLRNGRVCAAVRGIFDEPTLVDRTFDPDDEPAARRAVVEVVADCLASVGGWYHHHPDLAHPDPGPWEWDLGAVLHEAHGRAQEHSALGPWAGVVVDVRRGRPTGSVTLRPEAWELVAALVAQTSVEDLLERLGWSAADLTPLLADLSAAGVLQPVTRRLPVEPAPNPAADPVGGRSAAKRSDVPAAQTSPPAGAAPDPLVDRRRRTLRAADGASTARPVDGEHVRRAVAAGPALAGAGGPPVAADRAQLASRRSALRRLIDNIRPS